MVLVKTKIHCYCPQQIFLVIWIVLRIKNQSLIIYIDTITLGKGLNQHKFEKVNLDEVEAKIDSKEIQYVKRPKEKNTI